MRKLDRTWMRLLFTALFNIPHKEPRTGGNTSAAFYKERFLALEITFLSRSLEMRLRQLMPPHV